MLQKSLRTLLAVALVAVFAACGGGSKSISGSSSGGTSSGGTSVTNYVPVTIDSGAGGTVNTLYASVKICQHGSSTNCQTIPHVQVDTGSVGFRVLSSVVTVTGLAPATDTSGNAIVECTVFADGYSWGPVTAVDITMGSLTASNVPIQIIGTAAYSGRQPASCSTNASTGKTLTEEDTVAQFGANGILGVGIFAQDCGTYCADSTKTQSQNYYACPTNGTCTPAVVSLSAQVQNPVAQFSSDNNGVVLDLTGVTTSGPGATTGTGTLYFGIATRSNNAVTANKLYATYGAGGVEPGMFLTAYAGVNEYGFLDTGSNAYYFNDTTGALTACAANSPEAGFDCPSSMQSLSATITGVNTGGNSSSFNFSIDNAATLFGYTTYYVLPTLGGATAVTGAFDFGLPFHYGKKVFVAFDGAAVSGTSTGPWVGI